MRAQRVLSLGRDVLPGRGRSPCRDLLGAARRAQCARSLGERQLAGQGAVLRQGSAGRCQAGTVCLTAEERRPAGPGGGSPAGICWAPPGGRSVPDRSAVAPGPSQSSGPAGPAERRGPAGQPAGRVPGGARRRALLQARGTDSKGTGEQGCPVAGLRSLLAVFPQAREPDSSRWRLLQGWRRALRSGQTRPFTARLRTLRTGSTWSVH
jgi:hypothetical protein